MLTIVVADRMGKGQNVARGIEKSGAKAILIPGIGADMKLGDTMHKENADFGISFCGSGGAGALIAKNKYGYPERHGMRSINEGVTAVNDGVKVFGFGFMDKEELGEALVKAINKKYPDKF